jgi:hypothetical protein
MKKVIAVAFLSGVMATGWAATTANTSAAAVKSLGIAFIQTGTTAVLTKNNTPNVSYKLTMSGVEPYLNYYLPRPSRDTGLAVVGNFIKAWGVGSNSFKADNPNAVLFAGKLNAADNNSQQFYQMSLSDPAYDKSRGVMTYTATPINNQAYALSTIRMQNAILVIN